MIFLQWCKMSWTAFLLAECPHFLLPPARCPSPPLLVFCIWCTSPDEFSRHIKERRVELGFRTPAEARMQNVDERALPRTPNWGPFKNSHRGPIMVFMWGHTGLRGGQRGPLKEIPETSGINLHKERVFISKFTRWIIWNHKWSCQILNRWKQQHRDVWFSEASQKPAVQSFLGSDFNSYWL